MKYNSYVFLNKEELVGAGKLAFESYSKHNVLFLFLVQLRFTHAVAGNLSKLIQCRCWFCVREAVDSEL